MAATPDGGGYWLVASDGGIFAYGDAHFSGSMGGRPLNLPMVGIAADAATGGYWEVASDGGIFSFDAPFYGSTGGTRLNASIIGMEATRSGLGYRFVASDGGIFSYDAALWVHGRQTAQQGRRRHGRDLSIAAATAAKLSPSPRLHTLLSG